ncbi:hypothetical protein MXB_4247 [Myxobolus squamalis]|nr:hypothetical protein MXB_4247 [Myxobolus squamalis]
MAVDVCLPNAANHIVMLSKTITEDTLERDATEKMFHQACAHLINQINRLNVLSCPYNEITKINFSTYINKLLITDFLICVLVAFEILGHVKNKPHITHDISSAFLNYSDKSDSCYIQKKTNFVNLDSTLISHFSQISHGLVNSFIGESYLVEIKRVIEELEKDFNARRQMMIQRLRFTIKPMYQKKPVSSKTLILGLKRKD